MKKTNKNLYFKKILKIPLRKFRRIIFDLLFKNSLMKNSKYRELMNSFYRFFIYDAFLEPKKKYLDDHKNHLYLDNVKNRFLSKKYVKNIIPNFSVDIDNNFNDLFKVDIKKITSVEGSRIGSGLDPLCNTALQLIKNKNIKIDDLFLNKYFNNFQPKNLSEVYLIREKSKLDNLNPYNRFYPWHTPYPPPEHQDFFFGPKIYKDNEIRIRTYRLNNIHELVNKYGYIPDESDCIKGYILTNENDYRFIVTAGHHRSSVLNAMNTLGKFPNEVVVKFDQKRIQNKYFIVNKEGIENWPSVKNNFISKQDAILLFDSFFKDKIYFS